MQRARYIRLYADGAGETHFAEVTQELTLQDFAPPAPPLHIAGLFPTTRCGLVGAPTDWAGEIPHPSPRRQLFRTLQGVYEVTVSDGEVRRFPPGALLLLEDTMGKGHATRIVSEGEVLILALTLDAE